MKHTPLRWTVWTALLLGAVLASGCAKKPPAPTPPPPAPTTDNVPTPPPPPTNTQPETTPPSPGVDSDSFQPAFFDFDSYTLNGSARQALDADAKLLRDNATMAVTIEGHCDERGTSEYNQALGEKRAQAARDYLAAAGIAASRMQTISYGKEQPFDPGHDESAWAKNRRAHFKVTVR